MPMNTRMAQAYKKRHFSTQTRLPFRRLWVKGLRHSEDISAEMNGLTFFIVERVPEEGKMSRHPSGYERHHNIYTKANNILL